MFNNIDYFDPCDEDHINKILEQFQGEVEEDFIFEENGPKSWYVLHSEGVMSLQGGTVEEARATAALFLYLWHSGIHVSLARDLACSYWRIRRHC